MEYGICNLSVVPLRAEPNDRSEMVSQVLFGEAFEILEWKDKWVQITTAYDNYTGWIDRLQFVMLGHLAYKRLVQTPPPVTFSAVTQAWKIIDNTVVHLPAGASLAFLEGTTSYVGNQKFEIIGTIGDTNSILNIAQSFLNAPYLWGGRTHFGIDCSGFTQVVYKLRGIALKRDASQQAEQGELVDSVLKAKPGDLAFFNNPEGRITHVGIIMGGGKIIHASGKVKIDSIDTEGIYSEELKRHTHRLKVVKRYS
ncbi:MULTISPECIES: NlpC/P60 family protein [unclassified Mucilaginibacter]|uniref:C40 family peptidase n=1 Tax=unclassified Mucilaginibacter TaxID=2617802 RepID=UPI002AC8BFC0|nr:MULTISPECIES: NlpC/P60 family protein [unclassified Mucilaginibacter]MEB0263326.1 NlpC/P60 family protein [Mucilaginibacter sp. 10I4]MEB0280728.1 NlpC/P60 family protein [Mucilaginibacter sp. 10B2]MEB0301445.1 NlpC/P60 family protein [Mucilaginibacter sp. 5C4]WPX22683.1 NlpC/P60 family protein [Mucilaginibacter sp. 5C4]